MEKTPRSRQCELRRDAERQGGERAENGQAPRVCRRFPRASACAFAVRKARKSDRRERRAGGGRAFRRRMFFRRGSAKKKKTAQVSIDFTGALLYPETV